MRGFFLSTHLYQGPALVKGGCQGRQIDVEQPPILSKTVGINKSYRDSSLRPYVVDFICLNNRQTQKQNGN